MDLADAVVLPKGSMLETKQGHPSDKFQHPRMVGVRRTEKTLRPRNETRPKLDDAGTKPSILRAVRLFPGPSDANSALREAEVYHTVNYGLIYPRNYPGKQGPDD